MSHELPSQAFPAREREPAREPQPARSPRPGAGPGPGPAARPALSVRGLVKVFGRPGAPEAKVAVDRVDLDVPRGSFFGVVGRNGAGKTTLLSMATGLLRPTAGAVLVAGVDVWAQPRRAKQIMGVLPDGMHLFGRLTGRQLVIYSGLLRGMERDVVAERTEDLLHAMDLLPDAGTQVQDYSAGMTKKIALAGALVHAPSLLVLDEPFESVDPVSAANIREILHGFVEAGGTVVVSSHVMDLVQRMCDHVAVLDHGRVLAAGTVENVRAGAPLEDRFVELVGGRTATGEGLPWLRPE